MLSRFQPNKPQPKEDRTCLRIVLQVQVEKHNRGKFRQRIGQRRSAVFQLKLFFAKILSEGGRTIGRQELVVIDCQSNIFFRPITIEVNSKILKAC